MTAQISSEESLRGSAPCGRTVDSLDQQLHLRKYVSGVNFAEAGHLGTHRIAVTVWPLLPKQLKSKPWFQLKDILPCVPDTEVAEHVRIIDLLGRDYEQDNRDPRITRVHRIFTECEMCGREGADCKAMASIEQVPFGASNEARLACLYCTVYNALEVFVGSEEHKVWKDARKVEGQQSENHQLSSLIQMLKWFEDKAKSALTEYKADHMGFLPLFKRDYWLDHRHGSWVERPCSIHLGDDDAVTTEADSDVLSSSNDS